MLLGHRSHHVHGPSEGLVSLSTELLPVVTEDKASTVQVEPGRSGDRNKTHGQRAHPVPQTTTHIISEESQRYSLQQVYQDTVAGGVAEGAALPLRSKVEASVVLASPVLRHGYCFRFW